MSRRSGKLIASVSLLVVAGLLSSAAGAIDPDLVAWWTLDEGTGATASDSSGNKNHGALRGSPQWMAGTIGGALRLNGTADYVEVPDSPGLQVADTITVAAWVFREVNKASWERIVAKSDASLYDYWLQIASNGSLGGGFVDSAGTARNGLDLATGTAVPVNQWVHVAFVYDGAYVRTYINGQSDKSVNVGSFKIRTGARPLWLGRLQNSYVLQGLIDEACVYKRALTDVEIQKSMTGLADAALAAAPNPADKATDVPCDAILSWTPGEYPGTHDVYVGTVFADVNTASRATSKGLLGSQGQTAATFDPPGLFDYAQTYYWRIDEVNSSADKTIFKGAVWSFTTEPYGYPIEKVTATASSAQPSMGPEKTLDGSGLSGDQHGTEATTMWLSAGVQPNWIRYAFDKVYKLSDLKVWNSNQTLEPFLGFGAKEVKIEYSTDGTTWTALANVPPFAKAPGTPGYAAGTTVNFGGVEAKFVKLTVSSTWGGMAVAGLSEVRFSHIPVQARGPQPVNAATGVELDAKLDWRPGRLATSHKVYLGTNQDAVANGTIAAKTVADHGFTPDSLNFGTTYYWKVDEVNTITYPGDVWSFTTRQYAAVDDFESYTDKQGQEVFAAWADGMINNNGSIVGYITAAGGTFCETSIIHGGRQSMPFEYNNVRTPFYSEAQRTFDTAQNWTGNGADTLSLWFRGRAAGFVDKSGNAYTVSAAGTDIWGNADQFRFVYKQLNGNGSIMMRVDSIDNTNVWAKAGPMIRETLEAGARNAFIGVTPGSGVSYQWRSASSGTSANSQTIGLVAPYWVRITRTGNLFKAERSADGKIWIQQGTDQDILMNATVYIGIAVTSHAAGATTIAEISNVSTTGTVTGSWQSLAIGAAMPTNGAAPLYLVVEDKAGKAKTLVNANASGTTVSAWTEWRIPLSDLTGVNLAAVKTISLGVGDKAAPKAGAAGLLYIDDIGFGHPAQ